MKKLIFKASFLALATLTIFSACKKDEVIEPEFIEKADAPRYTQIICVTYDKITNHVVCTGFECLGSPGNTCKKPKECPCK